MEQILPRHYVVNKFQKPLKSRVNQIKGCTEINKAVSTATSLHKTTIIFFADMACCIILSSIKLRIFQVERRPLTKDLELQRDQLIIRSWSKSNEKQIKIPQTSSNCKSLFNDITILGFTDHALWNPMVHHPNCIQLRGLYVEQEKTRYNDINASKLQQNMNMNFIHWEG